MVTLIYHKKLEEEWKTAATELRDALSSLPGCTSGTVQARCSLMGRVPFNGGVLYIRQFYNIQVGLCRGAYHGASVEALNHLERCVLGSLAGAPLGLCRPPGTVQALCKHLILAVCLPVLLSVWEGSAPSSLPVCMSLAAQVRPWLDPLSSLFLNILHQPEYCHSTRFPGAGHPACR